MTTCITVHAPLSDAELLGFLADFGQPIASDGLHFLYNDRFGAKDLRVKKLAQIKLPGGITFAPYGVGTFVTFRDGRTFQVTDTGWQPVA